MAEFVKKNSNCSVAVVDLRRDSSLMRKIIGLALTAAAALAASLPALADSKSAAEFVLKTCLPAMDDLSKVEVMAQEGNWLTFPSRPATDPKMFASKSAWRVNKLHVSTWINERAGMLRIASWGC